MRRARSRRGLVGSAIALVGLFGAAPAAAAFSPDGLGRPAATFLDIPLIPNPGSIVGRAVSGVASAGVNEVLRGVTEWVAGGTAKLLSSLASAIGTATAPDVGASWFTSHYQVMVGIAVLLVLPLLLGAAISAIVRQDAGPLLRAVTLQLPLAALGTGLAIELVGLALLATDQLCATVLATTGNDTGGFLTALGQRLDHLTQVAGVGAFAVVVVALVLAFGALLVALELVMRSAAVYVAVLFLPLALAGLVWPATVRWSRRLVELLAVLILSKFVIVAVLSLAASALQSGIGGGDFPAVVAGAALILLSAFAPYTLLRLVPVVEAGAIGHLEGVGRRANPVRVAADSRSTLQNLLPGTPGDGSPPAGSAAGDAIARGHVAGARASTDGQYVGDARRWVEFGGSGAAGGGEAAAVGGSGVAGAGATGAAAGVVAPLAAVVAVAHVADTGRRQALDAARHLASAGDGDGGEGVGD